MHLDIETVTVYTVGDFRKWLVKNHTKKKRVALVLYKRHTGKDAPTHRELLEEAICFGWIDTTIKRLDEDRFMRNFTRRNENSKWSDNTLTYAKQLAKDKRMTPEGLKFYKLGLKKPTHDHGIPKNPQMPDILRKALAKDKKAEKAFKAYPPSTKRMFYRWLLGAKRVETQEKRVKIIGSHARQGKKSIL